MENKDTLYRLEVQRRSMYRFIKGLIPRLKNYFLYEFNSKLARSKGAKIGRFVSIPYSLAKIANSNLDIGNHTSIQSSNIDLRAKVKIGNNVIIGSGVQILTCSHDINSPEWEHKSYGLTIEDYSWIATNVFVLPTCREISRGSICAAGAVVVKNVGAMNIVSGNPAKFLKMREDVHSKLCVESLRGNDLIVYVQSYMSK